MPRVNGGYRKLKAAGLFIERQTNMSELIEDDVGTVLVLVFLDVSSRWV